MKIERIMVVSETMGICYCGIGRKTSKEDIKVEGGELGIRYCNSCNTVYVHKNSYNSEMFRKRNVLDDVVENDQIIIKMKEESKIRKKEHKKAISQRRMELRKAEKIIAEKEVAKAMELAEHKKLHEGKVEIYSHDIDSHYSKTYIPKSPKEKNKRSFFS